GAELAGAGVRGPSAGRDLLRADESCPGAVVELDGTCTGSLDAVSELVRTGCQRGETGDHLADTIRELGQTAVAAAREAGPEVVLLTTGVRVLRRLRQPRGRRRVDGGRRQFGGGSAGARRAESDVL